ncbi:MAG TPA: MlaD family protein [Rhodanobacteraceae bacterium]
MENRSHAIVAACFLAVLCVATGVIIYWLSSGPGEPRAYRIVTTQSVAGLQPQSNVVFKGLLVGHVTQVGFDKHDPDKVVIDFRVRRGTYVTHATYAELAKQSLMGGEMIELKLGNGDMRPLTTSIAHPAHIPLRPGLMDSLKASAQRDMADVGAILASTKQLLDSGNRRHLAATIAQVDAATARLVTLEKQLAPTLQRMPGLLDAARRSLRQSQALLANANQLARAAKAPVERLGTTEDAVTQLAHHADTQTVPDMAALSRQLMRTTRELDALIDELKAKPQSLLFGPPAHPPGPGEPGFNANKGDTHERHP